MEIITKKIGELTPYENNPRNNDEAVQYVANSISEFGWKVPVVIDKDNVVVAGHTRLKAAEKLGIDEIPCIVADDLSDEQIKAYRLADNKVSEFAGWDFEALVLELDDIELDMSEFGFDDMFGEMLTGDGEYTPLADRFLVPPFSVISVNRGGWLARKRAWVDFGIRSEIGRDNNLVYNFPEYMGRQGYRGE